MRLIDADALSEKLCETTIFIKDGEVFQRMINDAPTLSAEAVHKPDYSYEADMVKRLRKAKAVQGEWIESELDKDFRVCSVCKNKGYKDKMAWRTEFIKSYLNFCPNCGAKMKGGAE